MKDFGYRGQMPSEKVLHGDPVTQTLQAVQYYKEGMANVRDNFGKIQQLHEGHYGDQFLGMGYEHVVITEPKRYPGMPIETVFKMPAGLFPEVGEKDYHDNSRRFYHMLDSYYGSNNGKSIVVPTEHYYQNGQSLITQPYVEGESDPTFDLINIPDDLRLGLMIFLSNTLNILEQEGIMPPLKIEPDVKNETLKIHNIMLDKNDRIKLIDTSPGCVNMFVVGSSLTKLATRAYFGKKVRVAYEMVNKTIPAKYASHRSH